MCVYIYIYRMYMDDVYVYIYICMYNACVRDSLNCTEVCWKAWSITKRVEKKGHTHKNNKNKTCFENSCLFSEHVFFLFFICVWPFFYKLHELSLLYGPQQMEKQDQTKRPQAKKKYQKKARFENTWCE